MTSNSKNVTNGIKTIVFDFGGVIMDIDRQTAVDRFVGIGLTDADNLLDTYKQQGVFLELEQGKLSPDGFYDEMRKMTGKNISNELINHAWMGFFPPVVQGRLDCLKNLRRNYRLCLLSNTNPIVMAWARSPRFAPEGKPLDAYFDKLYLSYEMGITKPHEEIFKQLIEAEQLNPAEALFVDDAQANIDTANALGFQTLPISEGEDFRKYFE